MSMIERLYELTTKWKAQRGHAEDDDSYNDGLQTAFQICASELQSAIGPKQLQQESANDFGPAPDGEVPQTFIDVVFDGPPSHESGRFVECERPDGSSLDAGEWIDRGNGLWALRITLAAALRSKGGGTADVRRSRGRARSMGDS